MKKGKNNEKMDMIVIIRFCPATAVIRRKSLSVESKEKVKILQADAIRKNIPLPLFKKRWQSCQTFIDVLGKGILKQLITELS
ncbi:MAG: hypothetical protein ACLT64_05995 [Streptococcus salivarius]